MDRMADLELMESINPRYGFIKAWRAKIFAKIEWKDIC